MTTEPTSDSDPRVPKQDDAAARASRNRPSPDPRSAPDGSTLVLEVVAFCLLGAAAFFVLAEWPTYRIILGLDQQPLVGDERWLAPLAVYGKTLTLMLPGLLLASLGVLLRRPRAAILTLLVWHGIIYLAMAVDLSIYQGAGRHLTQLVAFLGLPRHGEVIGGFGQWVWMATRWVFVLGLGTAGIFWASRAGVRRLASSITLGLRRVLAVTGLFVTLVLAVVSHQTSVFWRHQVVRERVYGAMPVDLRLGRGDDLDMAQRDPHLRRLSQGLRDVYRARFPLLSVARPFDDQVRIDGESLPNVILIVLESVSRWGMSPETMPHVDAWSRQGLRLRRHYSGSIFSEAGMFSLIYGRSPLVYHAVLDAKLPPELCEVLRRSGYRCGYYSGHPKVWFRREEYINERTFDEFIHDDRGDWNQWDRTALANLVRAANAGDAPLFGLVFLMSTHFEYQYPPEYERHLPVTNDFSWGTTRMSVLDAESRAPLLNRYRNTLAFVDDELEKMIEALDPQRNIIVITADHGESFNDDGRFGHGSAFSEAESGVPMAIVGPGIPPGDIDDPTMHADLLSTVLHALTGHHVAVAHTHGRDLLVEAPPRERLLLAHCDPGHRSAEALLVRGKRRVRLHLGLKEPSLRFLGVEDERASLVVEPGLDQVEVNQLLAAFDGELSAMVR